VTAVIDRTAGLRGVVDGAEVLPFGGLHFGACLDGAWRVLGKEGNYKIVDFHGKEATELIKPECPVDTLRGFRKLDRDVAVDWNDCFGAFGPGIMVV